MASPDAHLLTLISLREGRLSSAEGMAVREQLADDATLRLHWQTLAKAIDVVTPLVDTERSSKIEIETMAAFVEGNLSVDDAAAVEHLCWENDAALRDVVAAFRSVHAEEVTFAVQPRLHHCLRDAVELEFGATAEGEFLESGTIHSATKRPQPVNGSVPTQANGKSVVVLRKEDARQSHNNFNHRTGRGVIVAVVVAGLLFLSLGLIFFIRGGGMSKRTPIARPTSPKEGIDGPNNPNLMKPVSPNVPNITDGSLPMVKHQDPLKPPSQDPQGRKPALPDGRGLGQIVQVEWTDISGVVARRWGDQGQWAGLLSSTKKEISDDALTVRTLPQSWVRGGMAGGPEIVVDSDSELQLIIRKQDEKPQRRTTVILQILQGRAAIAGLRDGAEIRMANGEHEWAIRSVANDTAVGLIHLDGLRRQIVVCDGAVRVDDMRLTAGWSVTWNGRTFEKPATDVSRHAWRLPPTQTLAMRKSLVDRINHSGNVLKALSLVGRSARKQDINLASNLSFALDAVETVPQAAQSNLENRRLAAINWLLAADGRQPETSLVWRKIEESLGTGRTQSSVRTWFQAAQSKTRPTQQQLGELSAGLGARHSLFVRQTAIHFLRQISGLRLAEYDAGRPTGNSIDSVRQKLRRVISGGRRRGN
jgi:hypothetical protein